MAFLRIGLVLMFVMTVTCVRADSGNRIVPQESFGGIVADQTVTVAGQDFFRQFVVAWRERDSAERYAIAIRERPSARWGSQVWIEYGQRRIFQAALPTGRAGIQQLSEQAADIAFQKVTDAEVERLLFRDADIGPDEI